MEDKALEKLEKEKAAIKKQIDKLYATTSVSAETLATEELTRLAKLIDIEELIKLSNELDIFGKCVLHYRLPIDFRLNVEFSKATEVLESERLLYWKDYKEKLKALKYGPEEEYNKIILMACTLHVPIKDDNNNETTENVSEGDK